MLFWDHNTSNLRDWSHNIIFWTLGSVPEPHFFDAGMSQTLIGTSYFNLSKLKNLLNDCNVSSSSYASELCHYDSITTENLI